MCKTVISEYFNGPWTPPNTDPEPLPIAADIGALYKQILRSLMPHRPKSEESIEAQIERIKQIKSLEKNIKSLELRVKKETQVNHRIAIGLELKKHINSYKILLEEN